jgi:hypothetical protein
MAGMHVHMHLHLQSNHSPSVHGIWNCIFAFLSTQTVIAFPCIQHTQTVSALHVKVWTLQIYHAETQEQQVEARSLSPK